MGFLLRAGVSSTAATTTLLIITVSLPNVVTMWTERW